MRLKLLSFITAVLLVGACSTQQETAEVSGTGQIDQQGQTAGMPGAPTPGSEEDFTVNVGDRVFFQFDQYELTPQARSALERQAQWLQEYESVNVVIEGHCDERGTRAYNLALGDRRATAVKNYLVALGVSPSRITTISYGKERPAVLGSGEAAWSQNRRAVTMPTSVPTT